VSDELRNKLILMVCGHLPVSNVNNPGPTARGLRIPTSCISAEGAE